jgi:transposase
LLLDNSGAHTAQQIRWPDHVCCVWLPPYCPELNPIERVWRDLKDDLAWQQFRNIDTQQGHVVRLLQAYDAATLPSLTSYTYWVDAVNPLAS